MRNIPFAQIIPSKCPVIVNAVSVRSMLTSLPTLQGVTKKAIVSSILNGKYGILEEDYDLPETHILVAVYQNTARILLDTSGEPLHKRGYRTQSVEAPLKETLAAALVQFADWKYKEPLYDMFCGSGTIAMEAMMIAKNMAPGKNRHFAFERFDWYDAKYLRQAKEEAIAKEFGNEKHVVIASDIDHKAIEIAKENAKNAGLEGVIEWKMANITEYKNTSLGGTLVSNPPYGLRMNPRDLHQTYATIAEIFNGNPKLSGGIITSYTPFFDMIPQTERWKHRKLLNGGEPCVWYRKLRSA